MKENFNEGILEKGKEDASNRQSTYDFSAWKKNLEEKASLIKDKAINYPEFSERDSSEYSLERLDWLEKEHARIMTDKFKGLETINGVKIELSWVSDGVASTNGQYELWLPQLDNRAVGGSWPVTGDTKTAKEIFEYACKAAQKYSDPEMVHKEVYKYIEQLKDK